MEDSPRFIHDRIRSGDACDIDAAVRLTANYDDIGSDQVAALASIVAHLLARLPPADQLEALNAAGCQQWRIKE